MLYAKVTGLLSIGSGEEIFKGFNIYEHDGLLGHVTELICINSHSLSPISFPVKFGLK